MKKRVQILLIPIVSILLFSSVLLAFTSLSNPTLSVSEQIKHITRFCVQHAVWDEETQTHVLQPSECHENVVFDDGKDAVADDTAGITDFNFTKFLLCNATAGCAEQTAGQIDTFNIFNGCGLEAKNASIVGDVGGTGNISIYATWTSTCDSREVNATKLQDEATGRNLSGTEFTLRTLNNNDEFRMNATLEVS